MVFLASTTSVFAEDVPVIAPISKGQQAPFDGVEMSPEAVANVIADKEYNKQATIVETNKATAEANANCDFKVSEITTQQSTDKKIATAQIDSMKKQNDELNSALKKAIDNTPNVAFWTGAGFVLGVGLTVLTVFLTHK